MKAEALIKRINDDLKSLQGMSKALPKTDRESLSSIATNFGSFEKSLNEDVTEPAPKKSVGQIGMNEGKGQVSMNEGKDSERLSI